MHRVDRESARLAGCFGKKVSLQGHGKISFRARLRSGGKEARILQRARAPKKSRPMDKKERVLEGLAPANGSNEPNPDRCSRNRDEPNFVARGVTDRVNTQNRIPLVILGEAKRDKVFKRSRERRDCNERCNDEVSGYDPQRARLSRG